MPTSTTTRRPTRRPSTAARRFGHVVAVVVNAAMLYVVNVWPGWDSLWFLTGDTTQVLGLVNASIVVGVVANAVYIVHDVGRLRSFGDLVTTSIGLAAMVVIWQVFPFDFGETGFDWELVVRIVLGVGIIGSAIAIITHLVSLVSDSRSPR
jgi:hypothetical protein